MNNEDIICKIERLNAAIICTRAYYDEIDESGEQHAVIYTMLRQLEDMADEIFHML